MHEDPANEPPPGDETHALLAQHRAGDAAALERLILRYYPRVLRIVRVRLGSELRSVLQPEDVVQDVFIRVLDGVLRYERRGDAEFIDWLARLAHNEIANHARRETAAKRRSPIERRVRDAAATAGGFDAPEPTAGVATKVSQRELEVLVDACLASLTEAHREVILLREYAGADWRSIAKRMQRSSAEACQELHRRARIELCAAVRSRL